MRQKFDSKILANGGAAATGEAPESFRCLDCSDWYEDFHRLDELTSFDECFSIKIPSTATMYESARVRASAEANLESVERVWGTCKLLRSVQSHIAHLSLASFYCSS